MTLQGEYEPSTLNWVREQVEKFEASNGAEGNEIHGRPIVVITSLGSRSGKIRKNPVMRVERDGVYAAVASKGGYREDPSWAENFRQHPEVELQDGPDKATYRARETEGEERATWWDLAVKTFPNYADYEKKADRQIPVFVLERV